MGLRGKSGEGQTQPMGEDVFALAQEARARGDQFFHCAWQVSTFSTGSATLKTNQVDFEHFSPAGSLGYIESLGWSLESVEYVHVPTRSVGAGLSGVTGTMNNGVVVGYYLFRASAPQGT